VIATFLNDLTDWTSWRTVSELLAAKIRLAEPDLALLSLSGPNGGRSSMVEPRIVVPDVAGSNPVGHPKEILIALSQ
jgi:hypothetical protein